MNPKSADRVLDVLELVAGTTDGLSRNGIARHLGIPKSSASVLLRGLVDRQYLHETADGKRLTIGVRAFETGSGFLRQTSLLDLARPAMNELVAELGRLVTSRCSMVATSSIWTRSTRRGVRFGS